MKTKRALLEKIGALIQERAALKSEILFIKKGTKVYDEKRRKIQLATFEIGRLKVKVNYIENRSEILKYQKNYRQNQKSA